VGADQVCIEAQQSGIRKREPNPVKRETSQILQKVFVALWAEKMTPERIAEGLGWPKAELDALTFRLVEKDEGRIGHGGTGGLKVL